jgi:hypothetical protein
MDSVSMSRVLDAQHSCRSGGWLNGDAVHMLVEQVVDKSCYIPPLNSGQDSTSAYVLAPGSATQFFASHSPIWNTCCGARDTLSHIEQQFSQQVRALYPSCTCCVGMCAVCIEVDTDCICGCSTPLRCLAMNRRLGRKPQ